MITINKLQFNKGTNKIDVNVSVPDGDKIVKVSYWMYNTFNDPEKVIDLSYLLAGTSNTEIFSIPLTAIGVTEFKDLHFLEFDSDNVTDNPPQIGVVGSLSKYYNCIINKVLTIDISNCDIESITTCKGLIDECGNNIYYLNSLLNNINRALHYSYFSEAATLFGKLKELVIDCTNCEDNANDIDIYVENNEVKPCM